MKPVEKQIQQFQDISSKLQHFKEEGTIFHRIIEDVAHFPPIERSKRDLERVLHGKMQYICKIIRKIEYFRKIGNEFLEAFAHNMTEISFLKGHSIMKQDEEGNGFYIILEGEVTIFVGENFLLYPFSQSF